METIGPRREAPQAPFRRRLVTALVGLTVVAAAAPGAVAAATSLGFGTVSVGATKALNTNVPLVASLSDLPPSTVVYAGGNASTDFALSLYGLSVPLTAGALLAAAGDVTARYHLSGYFVSGLDFDVDAPTCLTSTDTCSASVTFSPTTAGSRSDTLLWSASDIQIFGGGSFASVIQLIAPFVASSFASQLAISVDGIGVPSTGSVDARVDIAASAACIELSTSAIDFGALSLGAEDQPASPTITVTNCSGTGETLYARGTDASGPSSAWSLVDSSATCADTLGLDNYRLSLATAALPAPLGLSTLNKTLQSLDPGSAVDQVAQIHTACPGSSGAGVVMTMQIHYLVTGN